MIIYIEFLICIIILFYPFILSFYQRISNKKKEQTPANILNDSLVNEDEGNIRTIKVTKNNIDDFKILAAALKKDYYKLSGYCKRYPLDIEYPRDNPKYRFVFSTPQELSDRIFLMEQDIERLEKENGTTQSKE